MTTPKAEPKTDDWENVFQAVMAGLSKRYRVSDSLSDVLSDLLSEHLPPALAKARAEERERVIDEIKNRKILIVPSIENIQYRTGYSNALKDTLQSLTK
ncbi:MAG: hypothetical protein Q8P56_01040 [Candidatus Uhrbacteria bacterium]|nr:hypothetical protein [Candidatus Uhrbacteria bacterium]